MKLQFKEQKFQIDAVKAIVDCFDGQPLKTNKFTLERSKQIIKKAKQEAAGGIQASAFDSDIMEDIGYRNSKVQITESQVLKNIKNVQQGNDILESTQIERKRFLRRRDEPGGRHDRVWELPRKS